MATQVMPFCSLLGGAIKIDLLYDDKQMRVNRVQVVNATASVARVVLTRYDTGVEDIYDIPAGYSGTQNVRSAGYAFTTLIHPDDGASMLAPDGWSYAIHIL